MKNSNNEVNMLYGDMFNKDEYVRQRYEKYKNLLSDYISDSTDILDIGGYTGNFCKIIKNKKANYTVVDMDKGALSLAKKNGAKTVYHPDFDSSKIKANRKYDIILCTEVLEHLRKPGNLMKQMQDLLKDKGVALISVPNDNTVYHRFRVLLGRGISKEPFTHHYHVHFPTITQSKSFISRYFSIIDTRYWHHLGNMSFLKFLPWRSLTKTFPGPFSRGAIFLCKKRGQR